MKLSQFLWLSIVAITALVPTRAFGMEPVRSAFGNLYPDLPPAPIESTASHVTAIDDFNEDGYMDVLCHAYSNVIGVNNRVWVCYGQPDTSYTLGEIFVLDFRLQDNFSFAVGQVDADPEIELVARRNSSPFYQIHEADGSVNEYAEIGLSGSDPDRFDQHAPVVRLADLDEDGIDDIIMSTNSGEIFIRWSSLPVEQQLTEIAPALLRDVTMLFEPRDCNADGHLDLLIHDQDSGQLVLIEGTGAAAMGTISRLEFVPSVLSEFELPIPCDLDENPSLDIVQRSASELEIVIYYNITDAAPTSQQITFDDFIVPTEVVPDLDGNGLSELIIGRPSAAVNGLFTIAPQVLFDFTSESRQIGGLEIGLPSNASRQTTYEPWPIKRVVSVDMDNDSDLDILFLDRIDYFHGKQNTLDSMGRDQFGVVATSMPYEPLHVLAVNLDEDPELEAIVGSYDTLATHDFQTGITTTVPATQNSFMSVALDIEGDGIDEVVTTNAYSGDHVRILKRAGDGTLVLSSILGFEGATSIYGVAAGDFNEDGRDDLLVNVSNQGRLLVFEGQPTGALTLLSELPPMDAFDVIKPEALDFNRDGHLDLAIGRRVAGVIELYSGDGAGSFTLSQSIPDPDPYWLHAADVNSDGNIDLAVGRFTLGVGIHYLDENGLLTETADIIVDGAYELTVCDADQDGLNDIITASSATLNRTSRILFQQIDGQFSSTSPLLNLTGATGVTSADINHDGVVDVMFVSGEDEVLRLHLGIAAPCPADLNNDGELNFFDISAFITQLPDYNGDGTFNFFDVPAFIEDFNAGCP